MSQILLKNARLIDGLADQPQESVSILIDGDRISQVEKGVLPTLPNAQVIDLSGKTVLPGLLQCRTGGVLVKS